MSGELIPNVDEVDLKELLAFAKKWTAEAQAELEEMQNGQVSGMYPEHVYRNTQTLHSADAWHIVDRLVILATREGLIT